jgi:hypothetical protein
MKRLALVVCASVAVALAAAAADAGRRSKFYVTAAAAALVEQGLAAPAPTGAEAAGFQVVPAPSLKTVANTAQATTAPWITTNAWRFMSGLEKANYLELPPGSASMAAAEAFTYSAEAILNPDPADVEELGRFLEFVKSIDQPSMPSLVNIGVLDDKSDAMEEILNMLTRRNLLFRVVSAPDPKLDLTVRLGSQDFPKESADDPSDFAASVREKLTDDKRLVRLYGTSTTIVHLTGDGRRVRLYLLSFAGSRGGGRSAGGRAGAGRGGGGGGQLPRVRLLGHYRPVKFAGYGADANSRLTEVEQTADATEFTLPAFRIAAVVDLDAVK